jgi:hypothetical protein
MSKYTDEQLADLEEMVSTHGWQLVKRWIDQRMQVATRALIDAPPTDPAKIASLQAEIRELPAVVKHVERAIAKQTEE